MRECFDTEENITSGCSVGSGQRCSSRVLAPVILPADSRFVPPAATVYRPGRGDAAAAGGAARLADTVGQLRLGEEVVMGTTRQSGWRSTTRFSLYSTAQFRLEPVPDRLLLPLSVPSSSLDCTFNNCTQLLFSLSNLLTTEMQTISLNYGRFQVSVANQKSEQNSDCAQTISTPAITCVK